MLTVVDRKAPGIELLAFLRVRKKFWLLPIMAVMVIFGTLFVLAQGSAVAPFTYIFFGSEQEFVRRLN